MRGIVLAGGYGTRLRPMTLVTNKHLLPVYDRPMVYYPLQTLKDAGITDIMLITGPENAGDFLKLLGSGKGLGVRLTYRVQDEAGGIAQALGLCRDFADGEKCMVVLGDNIVEDNLRGPVQKFDKGGDGAMIFLKEVPDPHRFGVAEVKGGKIVSIEEKPKRPKSHYAQTGVYLYGPDVFDIIGTLKPSGRGELEITDVNNAYLRQGRLSYALLKGFWTDAGTVESLHRATDLVKEKLAGKHRAVEGKKA
jgi:glucose-1-phosphate thymidylyltransferase